VMEQDAMFGAYAGATDGKPYSAFKKVPIDHGMMSMLPPGAKMHQFDPKQPTTSYEQFQEKCLGEAIRPLNYPLNLALGTSQKFNFSSSRLDIVNYRSSLVIERSDCETVTLNPMFREWFYEALLAGAVRAWSGTNCPPHAWYWPGFESLEPVTDANADHARLAQGTDTWRDFWARRGKDWRDVQKQQKSERKFLEKIGIQFSEPVTRAITETVEDPEEEVANAV
jgi:capsid protein